MKKNKRNNRFHIISIKMFLFLIISLIILIILFFLSNKIIILFYSIIIILIYTFINTKYINQKNKIHNDYKKLLNAANNIIESSSQLIITTYNNFDSCFILLKDLFNKNNMENDSKLKLSNELNETERYLNYITTLNNNDLIKNQINEYKELIIQLDSFNNRLLCFINEVSDADQFLKKDIKEMIQIYNNKDIFYNLIIEFEYFSEIISEFTIAFVDSSKSISTELSNQIFNIKSNITKFINNIKEWEKEFFDKSSKINFDKVIENYKIQNEQLNSLYNHIEANNTDLNDKIQHIINMIEKIFGNINSIEDIAEKINIMAINASIISSRGQRSSKGFKVIASEIKSLADYTKSFINNIVLLIRDTKDIATKTSEIFKNNYQKLSEQIKNNKSHLNKFYEMLETYYTNFNSMFNSVSNLTGEIKSHIDNFNILIQHYDIEEQQMINLRKIIQDFLQNNEKTIHEIAKEMDQKIKNELLESIIYFIDKIITTKLESDVLLNIKKKYQLMENNLEKNSKKIEFF